MENKRRVSGTTVVILSAVILSLLLKPIAGWAFEEDELTAAASANSKALSKLYSYANEDEEEPRVTVSGVKGGQVGLPCNIQPNSSDDEVSLVLWYKDDSNTPIYSLDSRKTTLRNAHHAPVHWLNERAYLRTSLLPNKSATIHSVNELAFGGSTSFLELKSLEKEDEALYRCRVDFKRARTRNYEVQLKIIVPPNRLTVVDQRGSSLLNKAVVGPFVEGEKLVLKCQAHGGSPSPVVTWYRGPSSLVNAKEVILTQMAPGSDQLKKISSADVQVANVVENELVLQSLTRDDLLTALVCVASNNNVSEPLVSSVILDIYFRPQHVWITSPSPEILLGGAVAVFKCSSSGSRPPAVIQWFKGDEKMINATMVVDSNSTSLSSLSVPVALPNKLNGEGWQTSILEFVPGPDDDGKQLTCKADNPAMPQRFNKVNTAPQPGSNAIVDGVKLKVHYVPQPTVRLGTKLRHSHIREGHDVFLECDVKSNPPLIEMGWTFEDHELKTDVDKGIVFSKNTLVLQKVTRHNRGKYACTGTNSEGQGKSPPFQLRVRYEPTCMPGQRQIYGAAKNESVTISCELDGDPSEITFKWKTKNSKGTITSIPSAPKTVNGIPLDDEKKDSFGGGYVVRSEGTRSWLTIVPKSEDDYGTIICWGRNQMGMQTEPCLFSLIAAGPPGPVHNCSVINQTEESLTISCLEGYDGGSEAGQTFHMEVHDSANQNRVLIANISTSIGRPPSLQATGLSPSTPYVCTIYASNERGTSQPTILVATTIPKPMSLSSKGGFLFGYLDGRFKPSNFVVLAAIGLLIVIVISIVLVIVLALRNARSNHLNKKKHRRKNNKKNPSHMGISIDDDESVFPLRDIKKEHNHVTDLRNYPDDDDSKGPDIIPEALKLTSPSCSTLGLATSSFLPTCDISSAAHSIILDHHPQSNNVLSAVGSPYSNYCSLRRSSMNQSSKVATLDPSSVSFQHMATLPRRILPSHQATSSSSSPNRTTIELDPTSCNLSYAWLPDDSFSRTRCLMSPSSTGNNEDADWRQIQKCRPYSGDSSKVGSDRERFSKIDYGRLLPS